WKDSIFCGTPSSKISKSSAASPSMILPSFEGYASTLTRLVPVRKTGRCGSCGACARVVAPAAATTRVSIPPAKRVRVIMGPLCRQALATPLQQELIIDQGHAAVGGAANLL